MKKNKYTEEDKFAKRYFCQKFNRGYRPKIKRINSKKFRKLQKQAIRKKLEENND